MGTVVTMLWPTNGIGDAPAPPSGYTDAQTQRLFRLVGGLAGREATHGVFYGEGNNLAVSYTSPSTLSVATGAALVYGLLATHDGSATSLVLPGVAATTGGVVFVAVDWATQTGEVSFRQNTSGNTAIPALVQTALTAWEIPLATYQVTSGGVATVTDARSLLGVVQKTIQLGVTGSYNLTDTASPLTTQFYGLQLLDAKSCYVYSGFSAPADAELSLPMTLSAIVFNQATAANNVVINATIQVGASGGAVSTTNLLSSAVTAVPTSPRFLEIELGDISGDVSLASLVNLAFLREGAHASDNFAGTLEFIAFSLTYWGRT